jgi:hypothetical protein
VSFQEEKWYADLLEQKVPREDVSLAHLANLERLGQLLREKGLTLLLEQISEIYGAAEKRADKQHPIPPHPIPPHPAPKPIPPDATPSAVLGDGERADKQHPSAVLGDGEKK